MSDKILEAVKALGGDIGNIKPTEYSDGGELLTLEKGGKYCVFVCEAMCDEVICTVAEFNTAAAQWLKEAYMHNAAIDLEWSVGNVKYNNCESLWRGTNRYFGHSDGVPICARYAVICKMQEFIDYCEANKPKPKPVFTQAMADAGELPPVGCEVLVSNDNRYILSEHGEMFIGVELTMVSAFENANGEPMVAVSMDDGECCCFRAEMIRPIKSPRDKAIDDMTLAAMTSDDDIMKAVIKESSGKVYDWLKQLTPEQRKEFDL